MTSNIRPLRRRLRLTRGRLINGGRMNKEKKELSFFLVLTFFVIFGIIYLAEVLFLEDSKVGFEAFYDENTASNNNNEIWETPKPILPLTIGRSVSNALSQSSKSDKLAESLKRHQEEMERLIRNISLRISKPTSSPGPTPHQYDAEEFLDLGEGHLDAHWQPVNGTKHKFYVYSAYFDRRQKPVIRLIGATKTKKSDKVWCQLHFNESHTLTVPGGVTIIRENWNLKYSACFVLCTLPTVPKSDTKIQSVPKFVSIVSSDKEDTKATNKLPVLNADTGTGSLEVNGSAVGVCVKPMHFHYNKSLELLEFLELNKMLGVTKFTLYNDTVSSEVNCLLEHYIKEGSVVVLPWKLNIDSQTEIRTEGLFAALNDCLYRNMNDFRYLMLIDFDEFIVPHTNNTIPEMIRHVDSQKIVVTGQGRYGIKVPPNQPKITSAYSFQNAFFYLQFPDDSEASQTNLRVLRKTRKKSKFNPQKQRSKYICVPQNVKEAGNHFIWEFHRGSSLNVPTKFGFLHHYRVCEFGGDDCIHTESNVDRRMVHYRDNLVANITKVLKQLSSRCGLDSRLLRDLSSSPSQPDQKSNHSSILTQSNTTIKNIVNN